MASEQQSINIADIPALQAIAAEVVRTRQPRRLPVDGQAVTIIVEPATRRRPRSPRGKPTTADDPVWKIIGIAHAEQASDVSEAHDRYLADAYTDTHA